VVPEVFVLNFVAFPTNPLDGIDAQLLRSEFLPAFDFDAALRRAWTAHRPNFVEFDKGEWQYERGHKCEIGIRRTRPRAFKWSLE
jgi:hypothetical protein